MPGNEPLQRITGTIYKGTTVTWRRQWHPTPVLLPGESHGQRSLVGYSPQCHKESDRLSDFTFTFSFYYNS